MTSHHRTSLLIQNVNRQVSNYDILNDDFAWLVAHFPLTGSIVTFAIRTPIPCPP
ncbi:protein of unknown function [Citrobacter freundii]|nr:protein of unknown function [Citrobacter freundii]